MRVRTSLGACLLLLTSLAGCGSQGRNADHFSESADQAAPRSSSAGEVGKEQDEALPEGDAIVQAGESANGQDGEAIQRQIIYRATLQLVVEDFSGVPDRVETVAQQHGGFIADSTLQGASGSPRSGTWTIRVPVKKYGQFLEDAEDLGEFRRLRTESEEVTAEYYDVQTRIRNRKKAEDRLLAILTENTGNLEDVLKVEEHLSRVREEIERLEGRLRVLKDLTRFSTITLSITELKGYEPPRTASFGERVGRAWTGSLTALVDAAEVAAIAVVAAVPWLGVLAVPLVLLIFPVRFLLRRRRMR